MMRRLTHLGGARATVGAGVLLTVWEPRLGLATLMANAGSHLVVQILKRLIARARPCDVHGQFLALVDLPDPFSFPSGHAAAVTAVAASVTLTAPGLGLLLLPVAGVVAASRVTLRVHHLSDVIAGAGLGLAAALGAHHLLF
jgi:undecaprenyl-diphosphatase